MNARKSWQHIHPFKIFDEYEALENSLRAPSKQSHNATQLPIVADHLAKLYEICRLKNRPSRDLRRTQRVRKSSDPQLIKLMTGPSLSTSDMDSWLQVRVVSESPVEDAQEKLETALMGMISVASANSLRSLMQYLSLYWHSGLFGYRPMVKSARKQAVALLDRALEVHGPTHYVLSSGRPVAQTTVPDLDKFERFVNSFFTYLEIKPTSSTLDPLEERLFRLTCRGCTINLAQEKLQRYLDMGVVLTTEAVDAFVTALAQYIDVEKLAFEGKPNIFRAEVMKNLGIAGELLPTRDATAATTRFMLVWSEGLDEFWSVISLAEQSELRNLIFRDCQYEMLQTLDFRAHDDEVPSGVLMSAMFALLKRIEKFTAVKPETYDLCLKMAAKRANYDGILVLLAKQPNISVILDDLVPGRSDPSDLIQYIRTSVKDEDIVKFVAMLQRLGLTSEVEGLWTQVTSNTSTPTVSALLAFLASVSSPRKKEVIEYALSLPCRAAFCKEALEHQLCPSQEIFERVVKQSQSDPSSWTYEELEEVLKDIDGWQELVIGSGPTADKRP